MEQKNLRWSSKRFYFFMMAFTLNLILPKKTMDFLNGVQPIFPENWFGVFSKLDFGDFLCLQYFQQWTVQNLLIFSIVLFLLSLLPKAEPLSEKAWKGLDDYFCDCCGGHWRVWIVYDPWCLLAFPG